MWVLKDKERVEDFCKDYNHINYCEIIIHEDGMIRRVNPSHIETIRMIYEKENNMKDKESWEIVPVFGNPHDWYLDRTKCISVWYKQFIKGPNNELSENQIETLRILRQNSKIGF